MNYLAHGRDCLDDPYRLVGTVLPDLVRVADRRKRLDVDRAEVMRDEGDSDPKTRMAEGILLHVREDRWFHQNASFHAVLTRVTARLRENHGEEQGFRASVVSHLSVELVLDAVLALECPTRLVRYYDSLEKVDPGVVRHVVTNLCGEVVPKFDPIFERYRRVRFLHEYQDDDRLVAILDAILRRVRLPVLPRSFLKSVPFIRESVREQRPALLPPESS